MLLYSIIGIVSVLGNILVVCVVRKSKELRHTQYVYKSSIAVADIIWGLSISCVFLQECYFILSKNIDISEYKKFYLTTSYLNKSDILVYDYKINELFLELPFLFTGRVFELVLFVVMEFLTFLFLPITVLVSIITLVFSAADRYFALTFPFKYKNISTKKIAKVISTLIWVIIISIYIPFLFKAEQSSLVYSFVLQPCSSCTTESVKIISLLSYTNKLPTLI